MESAAHRSIADAVVPSHKTVNMRTERRILILKNKACLKPLVNRVIHRFSRKGTISSL
jgi:hypothetical protein